MLAFAVNMVKECQFLTRAPHQTPALFEHLLDRQ
jgi:hypothetical protein